MWGGRPGANMARMLATGSPRIDADRAFVRAARARRFAALRRRLRGDRGGALPVYDEGALARGGGRAGHGLREIPLCAIRGTLEPSRARLFDQGFRPAPAARPRWARVWLAEHRGTPLPPISVIAVPGGYAIRDGHHRVSVAHARGALTIDAQIDAPAA
jgi:hypothetical protein